MPHYIMNYSPSKVHYKSQVPTGAKFIKYLQHGPLTGPLYKYEYTLPEINESDLSSGAVDLGLSVKWASCNVGATKPYDSGLLFHFGRTDGYAYGSDLGTSFDAKDGLIKNPSPIHTTTSGRIYAAGETLHYADDAAHAAMGGSWRMPTITEMQELFTLKRQWCTYTFLKNNNTLHTVYGVKLTGNGNSIFIPAAGYFDGRSGSFYFNESSNEPHGTLWTSSVAPDTDEGNCAFSLWFFDTAFYTGGYSGNYCGLSVRGVCE